MIDDDTPNPTKKPSCGISSTDQKEINEAINEVFTCIRLALEDLNARITKIEKMLGLRQNTQ